MRKLLFCIVIVIPLCQCGLLSSDQKKDAEPFTQESGVVFLSDFNGNTLNRVTGAAGTLQGGQYFPTPLDSGIARKAGATVRFAVVYPRSDSLALHTGTLEALARYDSIQSGYSHLIDKSWQYAISAYNGKLAAWFGTSWWVTDVSMPVGKWAYVATTFDGDSLKIYLDGNLAASRAYSGTGNPSYTLTYDLAIGNTGEASSNFPFNGTIDAARISVPSETPPPLPRPGSLSGKRSHSDRRFVVGMGVVVAVRDSDESLRIQHAEISPGGMATCGGLRMVFFPPRPVPRTARSTSPAAVWIGSVGEVTAQAGRDGELLMDKGS